MISYATPDSYADTLADLGLPPGKAERLAALYPSLRGLGDATPAMLRAAAGLTERQARIVSAACRLGRLQTRGADAWRTPVRDPRAFADFVRSAIGSEPAECFAVALLTARQRVIDLLVVHRGTLSQVDVHPREVFGPAVQCGAHSVILAHNHPSGDPEPSDADVTLTARLVDAGALVGIPVLDHVVVTATRAASFAARGLL